MNKYKALKINGKRIDEHRLIAIKIFGEDACRGKIVHHKNGDKRDNRPENLELMTRSEHMKHHRQDLVGVSYYKTNLGKAVKERFLRTDYDTPLNKRVEMLDLNGQHVRFFKSCSEAGRLGFTATHVAAVCRGVRKSHKNFIFRFA